VVVRPRPVPCRWHATVAGHAASDARPPRAFIAWAIDSELRSDDPLRGLPTVRVPRREPRPADRAEVDRVLAALDGTPRTAILLAADLGLRCCEIATVTRDDLQHIGGGWWLWLTRKGGHRLRCAVPVTLAGELATTPPGQPLVPSRIGGHLSARGVSDLIAREFARAGSSSALMRCAIWLPPSC
jgi:integrase